MDDVTTSTSYDSFGMPSSETSEYLGATKLSFNYARDGLGRIVERDEDILGAATTWEYHYDLAGRLDEVKQNGTVTAAYTYDANGNRLSGPLATTTYTYDDQDRMLTAGSFSFTYSENGELETQTDTVTNEVTTYSYDTLGSLRSVALPNGDVVDYVIDGQNRRIARKLNGAITNEWLYDSQLRIAAELDGSGALVSEFIYGNTRVMTPDAMKSGGVTYRILSDHLGSPRLVINTSTGAVAQQMDFDEFGVVVADTSPGFTPFGFAGGLYDPDTGLVRFGARDYAAEVGRWLSKDPILFDGGTPNLYAYVVDDPVNLVDPSGLICQARMGSPSLFLEQNERVVAARSQYISDDSCASGTAIEDCSLTAIFVDTIMSVTTTYEGDPGEVCPGPTTVTSVFRRGTEPFIPPASSPGGAPMAPEANFRCETHCVQETVCLAE